jgi:hypothetical protein
MNSKTGKVKKYFVLDLSADGKVIGADYPQLEEAKEDVSIPPTNHTPDVSIIFCSDTAEVRQHVWPDVRQCGAANF